MQINGIKLGIKAQHQAADSLKITWRLTFACVDFCDAPLNNYFEWFLMNIILVLDLKDAIWVAWFWAW